MKQASDGNREVTRHEGLWGLVPSKDNMVMGVETYVASAAPGEESTENSVAMGVLSGAESDSPTARSSEAMPSPSEVGAQPAGESPATRASAEEKSDAPGTARPMVTKPRSHSECTLTSYEALEGSLKETSNENVQQAEADGSGDSSKNDQSKKSSSRTGSSENEDEFPSTIAVPSDESGLSDDAMGGPPRVITTTSQGHSGRSSSPKNKHPLRRGKWTVEEEAFVARVIQDFNSGFLDAPAGTTLRTYLSEKLQCDPMRITKKFTGDACIGKRVFHPAVRSPSNASSIDKAQAELENLERRWRRRMELQQRESAKKAAAAAVAAGRGFPPDGTFDLSGGGAGMPQENVVTRTASWLDRANLVLGDQAASEVVLEEVGDLHVQMQEVQRLIHEGPIIQQTSSGLPEMIDRAEQESTRVSAADVEPADKRLRTAEDAEALVGFLRSVRASAASGSESF